MRVGLLLFWLLMFSDFYSAQMRVDFNGQQSFVLKVNGFKVNEIPCHRIGFDWETKEKKFQVVTIFNQGDSMVQSLNYKSGYHQQFQLQSIKNIWKWQLSGENTWSPDSVTQGEIVTLDVQYQGTKNCDLPMDDAQWEVFYSEVKSNVLATQRMNTISMLSKGTCCTVEQWSKIVNLFELEDDKLQLLGIIKSRIFDWDHRMQLLDLFLIERYRNKAQQLLSQE